MRKIDKNTFPSPDTINNVVLMQGITSNEYYLHKGGQPVSILAGVDLTVLRGQVFGVDGNALFEIKLLLEIMANIRSYRSGRCVLLERGMMRKKRIILPHVFYIGNPNMLYSAMNVLEFLMFSRMKQPGDKIQLQEEMLDYLVKIGMEDVALTPLYQLTREYRAAVLLLVSAYSQSELIVYNLPECHYGEKLRKAMGEIAKLISSCGKTLVISTQDPSLIEAMCTDMAFLVNGVVEFSGPVQEFRHMYDHIVMTIADDDVKELAEQLRSALPQFEYRTLHSEMIIRSQSDGEENVKQIYRQLLQLGKTPRSITVNPKTVQNAREEFLRYYALH